MLDPDPLGRLIAIGHSVDGLGATAITRGLIDLIDPKNFGPGVPFR